MPKFVGKEDGLGDEYVYQLTTGNKASDQYAKTTVRGFGAERPSVSIEGAMVYGGRCGRNVRTPTGVC
jgi:hypothetical protein